MESIFQMKVPLANSAFVSANVRHYDGNKSVVNVYFTNNSGSSVLLGQRAYNERIEETHQTAQVILEVCWEIEYQLHELQALTEKVIHAK